MSSNSIIIFFQRRISPDVLLLIKYRNDQITRIEIIEIITLPEVGHLFFFPRVLALLWTFLCLFNLIELRQGSENYKSRNACQYAITFVII